MNLIARKQKLELSLTYSLDESQAYEYMLLKLFSILKISFSRFKQIHYCFKHSLLKSPHVNKKAQESFRQKVKKIIFHVIVNREQFMKLKDFFQNKVKILDIKIKRKII